MPDLILLGHPLSSCCQKVLIAQQELGIELEVQMLDLGDPAVRAEHRARWPVGKMPLLLDRGRPIGETSIIIEHLQLHHAAPGRRLLPADPSEALDVRLWDRLVDFYVMTPMQAITADLLRAEGQHDPQGVTEARERLRSSCAFIDRHLDGRTWLCGENFSLADCAAAPALFYAVAYLPLAPEQVHLAAYFDRLMERPSVARVVDGARPWLAYFPGRAGLARRFFDPERP